MKNLIKRASPALLNFTKSKARSSKPAENVREFRPVRGSGYMTVPEMLETMKENDRSI